MTGAEIETSCKVSGGNWVEVASAASSSVSEKDAASAPKKVEKGKGQKK